MRPLLTKQSEFVLRKRYLRKDSTGRLIETPLQMFDRVASAIAWGDLVFDPSADVESTRKKFLGLFENLWFLPNSPTLMNAGRQLGQLAACFVLPVADSIEGIFEALKNAAVIHKSGGGTGFSFSSVRPENDVVKSTAGVSSGPVSFMSVFDVATEVVKQGGTRRGANMAVVRVDHPDIEAFIEAKKDLDRLNNFNLSVGLTDDFMWVLSKGGDYDLINPRTGRSVARVSAERIFSRIVSMAWETGEPGVLFLDEINRSNPTPDLGQMAATNPCGEQPLLPYESCTLGSVNLSRMVSDGKMDFNRLEQVVQHAVHFLDNVIEVNRYPLPEIEQATRRTRKIGLGVMGFADMLIRMGIPYDSEEAVRQAETIMGRIQSAGRDASAKLAMKRGNFPAYQGSLYDRPETPYCRNATITTIAPTGSISIIAGTSSGVEPLFAVAHNRRVLHGHDFFDIHPLFLEMVMAEGGDSAGVAEALAKNRSIRSLPSISERVRSLFRTALDIDPRWHIRIQAAFQKHTDNAVSKTVNLSANASVDDVKEIFLSAHEWGCKGVTLYRDGSRERQVLYVERDEALPEPAGNQSLGPDDVSKPGERCPECGADMLHGEGCRMCRGCGFTQCG
jgi:ribonucleoside-diphosphate reductase alpha chain